MWEGSDGLGGECEFLRGEAIHPILSQAKPQAADELLWACARWSWEGFRVLPGIPGAHIAMRGHSRKNVARIKWWGRPDKRDQLVRSGRASWRAWGRSSALKGQGRGTSMRKAQKCNEL